MRFKDHFSGHAASYAAARPTYPAELFSFLASQCSRRRCAWDCATGNGQAAHSLSTHFERVLATDASAAQIDAAAACDRVEYRVAAAEASGLGSGTADLVTVAQALHWFDIDSFFAEAARVLRADGLLAYWCYGLCEITPECDGIVGEAYRFVDEYWPAERTIVDAAYADIEPPGRTLATPELHMQAEWTAEQMLDYIATWSANERYRKATGEDPLQRFAMRLRRAWGGGPRRVRWPVHLTVARPAG